MNEEFLHYIWKYQLLTPTPLHTQDGKLVKILNPGIHNTDSGPDFSNAKIKIGNTIWAGNVELHINSSDWNLHSHDMDKAYDNIILHVVYNDDGVVLRSNKDPIPSLELKGRFDLELLINYQRLCTSRDWIPCQGQLPKIAEDKLIVLNTLDKLLVERLSHKTAAIDRSLQLANNDWEEVLYQYIARSFGFKTNAEPFELLARYLPLKYLQKHRTNLMQLEALIFGMAGFLNCELNDQYGIELKKEYSFLKHKYQLEPLEHHLWKFFRLRPVNFPTIRFAQFAALMNRSTQIFSQIIQCDSAEEIAGCFQVKASAYWVNHYRFDKITKPVEKALGGNAINSILINAIAPFLFVYGKKTGEDKHVTKALELLEDIAPEKNSVITKWKQLGMPAENAFQTQALLELKNNYCNQKKCLTCTIGARALKSSTNQSITNDHAIRNS